MEIDELSSGCLSLVDTCAEIRSEKNRARDRELVGTTTGPLCLCGKGGSNEEIDGSSLNIKL